MKIRHSTELDIGRMMEIYSFARKYMAEHGNPNQWGPTGWPPEELIRRDIQSGNSYVCLNDHDMVVGTFFFIPAWPSKKPQRTCKEDAVGLQGKTRQSFRNEDQCVRIVNLENRNA